jgi:hypothetical protein
MQEGHIILLGCRVLLGAQERVQGGQERKDGIRAVPNFKCLV